MKTLDEIRVEIDAIDRQMAALYEQRMDCAQEVAAYKKEHNLPVLDAAREARVIEKNLAYVHNPQYKQPYEQFLQRLMKQSRMLQQSLLAKGKAAYCGIEGAFAHQVCEKLFPGTPKLACKSFEEVFAAIVQRSAQYGVIPLENSSSGLVGEVMDALRKYPVYIVAAQDAHIEQCLLGLPQASLKDIETVYSKDQALAQSKEFLEALGAQSVPYPNTALAAQFVAAKGDLRNAAIGSAENAGLYGLRVLARRIETSPSNTTRFLVISARPLDEFYEHCGLIVSAPNEIGALNRIVAVLSDFGLNMDTLQSRPIQERPFEYFFFIQGSGVLDADRLQSLLAALRPVCADLQWLGSYPIRKEEKEA